MAGRRDDIIRSKRDVTELNFKQANIDINLHEHYQRGPRERHRHDKEQSDGGGVTSQSKQHRLVQIKYRWWGNWCVNSREQLGECCYNGPLKKQSTATKHDAMMMDEADSTTTRWKKFASPTSLNVVLVKRKVFLLTKRPKQRWGKEGKYNINPSKKENGALQPVFKKAFCCNWLQKIRLTDNEHTGSLVELSLWLRKTASPCFIVTGGRG